MEITMIMIGNVSMIDGSAKKMNDTNEKCVAMIMRANEIGTSVRKEKIDAMTMQCEILKSFCSEL
jgi:hypothetical protein